jgi:hypothetical protein
MFKLAVVIWVMLGTVLAGCAVTLVILDSSLANQAFRLIPLAAIAGFIVAMPLSYMVSKRLS